MTDVLGHPMSWDLVSARDLSWVDLSIAQTLDDFPHRYLTEDASDHVYEEELEFFFGSAREWYARADQPIRAVDRERIAEAFDIPAVVL